MSPHHHDSRIDTRFVLGPNASLSVRGAWIFMGLASFATLGCALWCTFHGFWPVLPFAGVELAALGAALLVSMRRNAYREVVTFCEERVVVEFGLVGRGAAARVELLRGWTRVSVERSELRNQPTRLVLGSSGQRIEIGRCLTDEEREILAARFKSLLEAGRAGCTRSADGAGSAQEGMTLGDA
ncbi:MAG: DUF2244 domain-containing protein [Panacagrimonas sp.]